MILVLAEVLDGQVRKPAFESLLVGHLLGRELKLPTAAAVLAADTAGPAEELARFGASDVFTVSDPGLGRYTPDGYATVLAELVRRHTAAVVVIPATANGKDLAATLAARLECDLLPDVTGIEFEDNRAVAVRPIYAGKALQRLAVPDRRPVVISVRPRSFDAATAGTDASPVKVEEIKPERLRAVVADVVKTVTDTVELSEADVVISGGRGLKGPEAFALLEELAKVLNAAVGASRAAVDAGWRDHQFQVGQTGRIVAPTVYIACGISGAIQHLVGMVNSKCIVAINKDPEANIFKVADYGLVGDLFKVLPLLTEEFRKRKGA
ncbi:MAG TPA: electron transfer flavoprotein subunit alpha/FixB family protein [candidate division WOR-3 bacterium]|uniref:Electron transfer flavoprotein subunit alpha/FixB family protein n=1 Tax=candidate division WOR-3 bacterium TaxID=2052148 RepID=A0A7V0T5H0_UNCW3|nr:electron transfer flavoprotein subunit alpha/FixB family protein [candidate division WOR-3 bacterium]